MKEKQIEHEKEWKEILAKYPKFARAHLAQQAILMEAALSGDVLVARRMCSLLDAEGKIIQIFNGFWVKKCRELKPIHLFGSGNEVIDCLVNSRDPGSCFDLSHGWFDDPLNYHPPLPEPPKPPFPDKGIVKE